jgi:hypothetical protein
MSDYHLSSTSGMKDEYVHEVCRYGGAEPHALAALVITSNVNMPFVQEDVIHS